MVRVVVDPQEEKDVQAVVGKVRGLMPSCARLRRLTLEFGKGGCGMVRDAVEGVREMLEGGGRRVTLVWEKTSLPDGVGVPMDDQDKHVSSLPGGASKS